MTYIHASTSGRNIWLDKTLTLLRILPAFAVLESGIPSFGKCSATIRSAMVFPCINTACSLTLALARAFYHRTSAWDNEDSQGTQTVNAIVLVEIVDPSDNNVKLDATSENYRWISLDAASAKASNEDEYVVQALLRLQAWNPSYEYAS